MLVLGKQKNLTKEQYAVIRLLSVGAFLEFFNLMLYVHMVMLLNELFFPPTDSHTASLLIAFSFCITFVVKPVGTLLFDLICTTIGRKATVVITTSLTAISCIIMANLPTYEQIGISSAWLMIICRIIQGMSSREEVIGAEIYLTETMKSPVQYPAIAFIGGGLSILGSTLILAMLTFITSYGLSWRMVFWIGAGIALVGVVARTTLQEMSEFATAALRVKRIFKSSLMDSKTFQSPVDHSKVSPRTSVALMLLRCARPMGFYIVYIYCGEILHNSFNCTIEQIIQQNFIVSIVELLSMLILVYLSYKIYAFTILKIRLVIFGMFILFCPYLLHHASNPFEVLCIQSFMIFFVLDIIPAVPLLNKHFPILNRFSYTIFLYDLSRALIYALTSFGLVYLVKYLGDYGLLVIILPIIIGYWLAIIHFEQLEKIRYLFRGAA